MVSAVLQLHAKQLYDVLIGLDIYKCCICTPKFNVLVSEPINGSKKKNAHSHPLYFGSF